MARQFEIPSFFGSSLVAVIKAARGALDSRKRDLSPTELDLGVVRIKLARHFGFCYGVENAIEIAYRALAENHGKRVFLLSEMIHNPEVNSDLLQRGVRFLMGADGNELVPFSELSADDIVIVPAFGATREIFAQLAERGIDPLRYNTTCPFVEKVWKRAKTLGEQGYTVVIHGKSRHEETRATYSHARHHAPSIIIEDLKAARLLVSYLMGERSLELFGSDFGSFCSYGFNPEHDLLRIGVVNQTTMLAGETGAISAMLREAMARRYGAQSIDEHFADTRDTLCYATTENQEATRALIDAGGDLAIVVGGYNSSNTAHLVEMLSEHFATYFIRDAREILSSVKIRHFDLREKRILESEGWLPQRGRCVRILLTSGASCPDRLIEEVVRRVAQIFEVECELSAAVEPYRRVLQGIETASECAGG